MQKIISSLFLVSTLFFSTAFWSQPVGAVNIGIGGNGTASVIADRAGYDSNVTETTLSETIGKVIKTVLSLVGTIFFVLTVYAGFLWMTAQGNEEQVSQATGIIKTSVIGLLLTLASYSITYYVLSVITKTTRLQ